LAKKYAKSSEKLVQAVKKKAKRKLLKQLQS